MLSSQFNRYTFIVLLGFIASIVRGCSDAVLKCPFGDTMSIGKCWTFPWNCFPCNSNGDRDDNMVQNGVTCNPPPRCSDWKTHTNGCSAPSGIAWAVPSQAKSACDMHDLCYRAGVNQIKCDNDFYDNLVEVGVDLIKAEIMYQAVANKDLSGNVQWGLNNCYYDPVDIGCKVVHDYPSCKPNCLVNNGGCPNNVNCHQVINRIYRVNNVCYQAKSGCYGCLESPNSYPAGLVRLDSCAEISDYPHCGQNCLANYGGCPNGNCHQVRDRIYRVNGKCYQATTTCWGCLPNADSNPSQLNPLSECKLVHNYPSCKPNCLTNNGQIKDYIYRVNGQCYQAISGCIGCLETPGSYQQDLRPLGQCTADTSCDTLQSEVVFIAPPIPPHSLNPDKYTYDDNNKYYFAIKFTKSDQILFQLITVFIIIIMVFGLIGGWIYCKKRAFAAKGNVYGYKTKIAYADDYDSEQQELNN